MNYEIVKFQVESVLTQLIMPMDKVIRLFQIKLITMITDNNPINQHHYR